MLGPRGIGYMVETCAMHGALSFFEVPRLILSINLFDSILTDGCTGAGVDFLAKPYTTVCASTQRLYANISERTYGQCCDNREQR